MAKKFMKKTAAPVQARTRSAHRGWSVRALEELRLDGDTQSRVELDESVCAEYAEKMVEDPASGLVLDLEGEPWPPLVGFDDGEAIWLVDGFHRTRAAREAGLTSFQVDIKPGEVRDAVRLSLSVNARHGLRRTRADKRRAIIRALEDSEWVTYSDRKLAQLCAVSPRTVASVRSELEEGGEIEVQTERVGLGGQVRDVSTVVSAPKKARGKNTSRGKKKDVVARNLANDAGLYAPKLEAAFPAHCIRANQLDSLVRELAPRDAVILTGDTSAPSLSAVRDHLDALLHERGHVILSLDLLTHAPRLLTSLHERFGTPSRAILSHTREVALVFGGEEGAKKPPGWIYGLGHLIEALDGDTFHIIQVAKPGED